MLSVKSNIVDVLRFTDNIIAHHRSAVREALNRTADWIDTDLRREMRRQFDRPVPFTLRSLKINYARTANLNASVWFRQRSADADKLWALAQIEGGQRALKPMELRLRSMGVLPAGWYVVPGEAAPLDGYGNMSAGEITRILNVLGAYTEAGYNKADDKTRARLRKGNVKKNQYGFVYWVNLPNSPRAAHLLPGVYRRVYTPFGTSLKPMMLFVKGASYSRRLDYAGVINRTAAVRFPEELKKATASLLATGSASGARRAARR